MNILFFGSGSIARKHCLNIRELYPEASLVFFREDGRANDLIREYHARVVSNLDNLPNFDAAFICTPAFNRNLAYEFVSSNKIPTYIEKPLITNEAGALTLKALWDHIIPFEGFNLRYLGIIQKVKRILESGQLGTICRANFTAGQYLPDWRPDIDYRTSYSAMKSNGGGVIFDLIHEVDLAHYFFGSFDDVLVKSHKLSSLEIDTDDTGIVLMSKAGGPLVCANLDYISRNKTRKFEIVGDVATLFCDVTREKCWIESNKGMTIVEAESLDFNINHSLKRAVENFFNKIHSGKISNSEFKDTLLLHECLLAGCSR